MDIPLSTGQALDRQKINQLAWYALILMVIIYGISQIKEIVAFVLMELYKFLIQGNLMPTL